MKFALALILSLLFIDSVLGCRPAICRPGYYRKCDQRPTFGAKARFRSPCYFLSGCKCVKKEGLKIWLKIK